MAMDEKPENACMPKEEVSQDQECIEDIKVNAALKIGHEITTDKKALEDVQVVETETETEQRELSLNDNDNPTQRIEEQSLEDVKVIEKKGLKDVKVVETEIEQRESSYNDNDNPTQGIEEESLEDVKVKDEKALEDVQVIETKTKTETETEQRKSSYNDNDNPTQRIEEESLEDAKVTDEKALADVHVVETETEQRESSYNDNDNPTQRIEEESLEVAKARDEKEATKEINYVEDENDEKKCESSSTNDIDGDGDFSKNCVLHLNEREKKALAELRSKLEEAILTNKLFEGLKKEVAKEHDDQSKTNDEKQTDNAEEPKMENPGKSKVEDEIQEIEYKDMTLWGVPLLPSKGDERLDVILEKFLKAREFKANDAFEMFRNTLWWRKQNKIDSILEEDFGGEYDSVAYMSGFDLDGHPVCYNVYGVFRDAEVYNKTFGTEESRQRFLRWRLQMMEKQIQKLNFKPGGVSSLLQINDLENTPGPSRKDIRIAMKQAVATLQENYPEFVHRNIFINVPFWYYAFNALLSPFLAPRTKSKFVFIRPARVTETLLKYVSAAEIPIRYGGLKRGNESDFSIEDGCVDVIVKGGSIETIEVPAPEKGCNLIWDVTVIGWEVNYKEEFVPESEGSYTVIIKKERRMGWQEDSVRNTFVNSEPGKVVLTIENASFKKKRVLYRHKTIKSCTSSS